MHARVIGRRVAGRGRGRGKATRGRPARTCGAGGRAEGAPAMRAGAGVRVSGESSWAHRLRGRVRAHGALPTDAMANR